MKHYEISTDKTDTDLSGLVGQRILIRDTWTDAEGTSYLGVYTAQIEEDYDASATYFKPDESENIDAFECGDGEPGGYCVWAADELTPYEGDHEWLESRREPSVINGDLIFPTPTPIPTATSKADMVFHIERRFGSGWTEVDLSDCLVAAGDWADEDTDLQEIWDNWDGTAEEFAEAWTSAYFDHFCDPPDEIRITVESQSTNIPILTPTRLPDTWKAGVVSHGTLRPQDLIPAFLEVADIVAKDRVTALLDSYGYTRETDWEAETETGEKLFDFLNYDLWDLLNDIAPEGTGFGAHPGDGACFGFWQIEED